MTAKALLAKLTVKAENNYGYDRDKYFGRWNDADKDCQNTRAEVLILESTVTTTFTSSTKCTVATGKWVTPFDGLTHTSASAVDIDHHVPVHEAWGAGAKSWTQAQRVAFYNDLAYRPSLNAMTANLNSTKQARDPAEWLPPRNQCTYSIWWVQVKYRWKLSIDSAEKTALGKVLTGACGDKVVTVPSQP